MEDGGWSRGADGILLEGGGDLRREEDGQAMMSDTFSFLLSFFTVLSFVPLSSLLLSLFRFLFPLSVFFSSMS